LDTIKNRITQKRLGSGGAENTQKTSVWLVDNSIRG